MVKCDMIFLLNPKLSNTLLSNCIITTFYNYDAFTQTAFEVFFTELREFNNSFRVI